MFVNLYNPRTNQAKQAKVGFSWTVFFFGSIPALFRGDWKWFFIMLLANTFTAGFAHLVFMFLYNKLYLSDLIVAGFVPSDEASKRILLSKGFIVETRQDSPFDDFDDLDF
ncbi:DUF2628 domain-containing protein [Vagococcus carniphilus]|uniref:DUF2628 domain-containing protein n=1 Tax=Vagococcus carniphilus TaxID=218144 RepID=A0AAW8UAC1_9ENTE|nr:DUF2628 domain-containing protein [Vagococcus carniphilus]MDT2830066.1 DUF2628 domain-containing protein [Vagococcus carniphilus]MDT2833950.1 DUF2628 domain-containing protein [Vagococcus carniphilus]MDT2838499.1 DUF2628 domain-containing protein [Vagococcus carniphilus]MDT2848099.1 DUF2628 domain-containing protein [Vagococcus carniphilus]MDT2853336.1 DUF2628 domain-containing protein [Vagococcus carniphilus]